MLNVLLTANYCQTLTANYCQTCCLQQIILPKGTLFRRALKQLEQIILPNVLLTMGQWRFMCIVYGYHVYKELWEPFLNDEFTTKHQRNNPHDYAVAVLKTDAEIVGHLPRELSKIWYLFILHGCSITGVVKGRRCKTHEPCGGMEIQMD